MRGMETHRTRITRTRSDEDLARDYAEVRGFTGRTGGWIYNPWGQPVAHGWSAFATLLRARRRIIDTNIGPCVNWRADDTEGRFAA